MQITKNNYHQNKKINLSNTTFYIFLIGAAIYILSISIGLIINFSAEKLSDKANTILLSNQTMNIQDIILELKRRYLISYLVSALLIISFIVYSVLAKNRIRIGYGYCLIWAIVWLAVIVAPIILTKVYDVFYIINCMATASIFIGMFLVVKDLYLHRELLRTKMARLK
ncbi:hypothetical protein [Spiroplasma sp. SV19]|uniref:hypothetical protein n=1 Tax=Spiroplasma sp. SV19 TaxID=2570468 RepID=UPI0024B70715|nr:hypothetical protein [Spiroplasma sp. SV19]WHQ37350.1 hypothetical protein E7Y35_05715 [Spiroplasma sp. SV19]